MFSVPDHIFKAYDIRGIYPTEINEKNIEEIIKGIYSFFVRDLKKENLNVALGRDMRVSSPSLFKIAKNTLLSLGATVIDIGLVSTPTFYFSVLHYKYDSGIQISASHNPPQYNGIKFVKRIGKQIIKIGKSTGMDDVKTIVLNKNFITKKTIGKLITNKNVKKDEIDFAFKIVKPKHIKKLKVVADPANAMGITYIESLFKRLPCKLIKMNFKLDGTFPAHQPNPLEHKNVKDLESKVQEETADLGIAPDGDGDRLFFVDEKGKIIPASITTSILANDILKNSKKKEKVLIDVRYTKNISEIVKKNNGTPIIGKVGHALITEHMIREDVIFCGESSGHYFYRDTGYAESGVLTILRLLEIIGKENKSISKIANNFAVSNESGEFNFILQTKSDSKLLLAEIAEEHKEAKISWLDGLSIEYPTWRFNIRTSNTEPLLRLNIEANSKVMIKKKIQELKQRIYQSGAREKH